MCDSRELKIDGCRSAPGGAHHDRRYTGRGGGTSSMFGYLLPSLFLTAVLPANQAPTQNTQQISTPTLSDPIAIQTPVPEGSAPVCLKLRVYQFARNDGQAPQFVRETTCTAVRPFAKKAKMPKARLIPAN